MSIVHGDTVDLEHRPDFTNDACPTPTSDNSAPSVARPQRQHNPIHAPRCLHAVGIEYSLDIVRTVIHEIIANEGRGQRPLSERS